MKNQNYDKRIFRFLSILNQMDSGKTVSTPELASDFNVTLRTIQRDIELLNLTGFPLVALQKGRYGFVEGFSLKKSMLSEEEASLLSLMFDIAKSLGGSFEESFRGILRKVLNQGKDSAFYIKIPRGSRLEDEAPCYHELEQAIDSSSKICVQYRNQEGKKSEFEISPLKLIRYEGFWYLLCFSEGKGLIKLRLDGIASLRRTGESFECSKNLKAMLDESVNVWFPEKRSQKVLLELKPAVASYFKKKIYFPLQKIVKEYKDGRLIVETRVSHQYMEIIPTIHQWLPMIKILAPKELMLISRKLIREYQKSLK